MRRKGVDDLVINDCRLNADAFDQMPGEALLQQEFGLLALLVRPLVAGLHGSPVDLVQAGQIVTVFEEA